MTSGFCKHTFIMLYVGNEENAMAESTRFKSKWDPDSNLCPHGHEKYGPEGCMRLYPAKKGQTETVRPVCVIKKREQHRAAYDRRRLGMPKNGRGRPSEPLVMTEQHVHPVYNGGTELSGAGKKALVQLVCGHIVIYGRGAILANNRIYPDYDSPLYCQVDEEWKKIHKIGAMFADEQATVLHPLEVAAEKACFLQSEFLRIREADRVRNHPLEVAAKKEGETTTFVVGSLNDLRIPGSSKR